MAHVPQDLERPLVGLHRTEDDLGRVMKLMTRHRVRHMPVLRDGKLSGIISIGDVVKHRLDNLELEANVLRDVYIAHH